MYNKEVYLLLNQTYTKKLLRKHVHYRVGVYCYTLFYTATNVHSMIRQVLRTIHASLAIENSFMRSLVRGTNGPVFMLRETGTNGL